MLWAWELKEFKLSRELSLLCTLPPPPACAPLRWGGSSRSEYQLSPNPLSLMLLSLRLGDSCRAFCAETNTHTDFRVSNTTFTFPHSSPCLHLWVWVCSWVSVFVCVYRRGWNLFSHTVNTHYTVYKNQCTLQLIWKEARVFYSLLSLSKQTPTCPAYPDDYVYGTETMGLHVNP